MLYISWCRIAGVFQTTAIAGIDDYNLKYLAEVFDLSGELLI